MALVFTLAHVLAAAVAAPAPAPTPDEWVPNAHLHLGGDDGPRRITAYINVSFWHENGWKWSTEEAGRYGDGYVGPAAGVLVHVAGDGDPKDHTGCRLPLRSTRPDRAIPPDGEHWVALMKRGRCNFETKVENAYRNNAAAVLIYNDRDSHNLDKMVLPNSEREFLLSVTYSPPKLKLRRIKSMLNE